MMIQPAAQLEAFEATPQVRVTFAVGATRPKLSVWTNPAYRESLQEQRARRPEPRLGWGKLVGIDPTTIVGGAL
jgi:hypothetical protein